MVYARGSDSVEKRERVRNCGNNLRKFGIKYVLRLVVRGVNLGNAPNT